MTRFPALRPWVIAACLVVCAVASVAGILQAATAQGPATDTSATSAQTATPASKSTTATQTSSQAETQQYTLSHERYEKAVAYSRAGYTLYFVSYFLGVLVLVLLLRLGIAAKIRDIAQRLSENRILQGLVFVPMLIVLIDVLHLPVHMYWHSISLRYEQSVQGWGSWFWDWTKAELLGTGLAVILALILFSVIRWSPRRWWLYFWFAALPILVFLIVISPWYIEPLFHKFKPLKETHPELVTAIQKLTQHAGVPIPPERMFLMEASAKTNTINAYVTGLGASKRVVIWDTTIDKTTTDEALFIVGHELGHYVLGHVRTGLLFGAAGLLLALYAGYRGLHWTLDRWGKSWKVYGQADWAALAVLLLVLNVLTFVALPVGNGFSRMLEHAADVYGLEVIHGVVPDSEQVAAHAFQVIGEIDLADPNPPAFITLWLYSHPPLAERLVFAHSYDPWSKKGESPKYVK